MITTAAKRSLAGLGALALMAGCGIPKEKHFQMKRQLTEQIQKCRKALELKGDEATELGAKLSGCRRQVADLNGLLRRNKETLDQLQRVAKGEAGKAIALGRELQAKEAALVHRTEALRKKEGALKSSMARIAALQGQIDRFRRIFEDLQNKLQSLVKAGKLTVQIVRGWLVVQLPERILFPLGSARLKKEGKAAIASLTELLKVMKHRWLVAGHTDDTGSAKYNWQLSLRRAMAVLQVMLDQGMPPELVSAAGFGQYQPVVPNDTKENRALNRRTEVLLVPNLEKLLAPVRPSTRAASLSTVNR